MRRKRSGKYPKWDTPPPKQASYGDRKFYGRTPAEFRKMAEDLGIAVTGAHIARELDKNDMQGCMDWWKQACDAQAAVGGKTIVMPYFPGRLDARRAAGLLRLFQPRRRNRERGRAAFRLPQPLARVQ